MANEETQEQIDLNQILNNLLDDQNNKKKIGSTTIQDRIDVMQKAVAAEDDVGKLTQVQNDLKKKTNELLKQGKTRLAAQYKELHKNVGLKLAQVKIDKEQKKLEKQKFKEAEKMAGAVTKMGKSAAVMFGISGGLLGIFKKFNELTRVIGQNFGAIGMQNQQFKDDMLDSAVTAAELGQDIKAIATITKELSKSFGFSRDEAAGMANGIMDTSMALALSNEEGTKLIGTLMKVSGLSFEQSQNFSKNVALLADSAGAAPTAVLKDLANSSEAIAKFTGMTPDNLAKAAIQANKLGTTLDGIAKMMEGMLNFQDSLNAEIEASLLLGRSLNLQKARELALAGKAEEFAIEITKQVGSQEEFERLLLPQRQALAKALNMSVEQLAKMVRNQDKVYTLGEAIAKQPGLETMVGPNAMDAMAEIVAKLQAVGTQLVVSIGPTVASIAESFLNFLEYIGGAKTLIPVVTGLLGLMLGKSIANFVFSAATALGYSAGFMGPAGLALILGIPAIIGAVMGSLMAFETGTEIAGIKADGVAQLHKGETVLNAKDSAILGAAVNGGGMTKQDMESAVAGGVRGLVEENKKIRQQNQELITATRRQAAQIGDIIGDMA